MYDIRCVRKLTHEELITRRLTDEEARSTSRHPISVILEDIRSLYNVGSIFRSADAFLVQELVLCGFTPTPPRKEIAKTALGADETVPWTAAETSLEAITHQERGGMDGTGTGADRGPDPDGSAAIGPLSPVSGGRQ